MSLWIVPQDTCKLERVTCIFDTICLFIAGYCEAPHTNQAVCAHYSDSGSLFHFNTAVCLGADLFELFWKSNSFVSGLLKCMCTMRYCARNQSDFGIKRWHCCTKGQTRALWDCHFGSSQFCRFLLRLKVFRSITFKYLHDSKAEYSDAAVLWGFIF